MVLDWHVVFALVMHGGSGECLLGRAPRRRRRERLLRRICGGVQPNGVLALAVHIRRVWFLRKVHPDQRRRKACNFPLFRDNQRDRLAAKPDSIVVEWPEW